MTTPLYFDNFCLRFNSNLNALEYNSGNEVWVEVPVPTGAIGLTNGKILVGNASNLAAPVSMSGGATISNTGVVTLNIPALALTTLHTFAGVAGVATDNSVLQVDVTHTSVGINTTPDTGTSFALKTDKSIYSGNGLAAANSISVETNGYFGGFNTAGPINIANPFDGATSFLWKDSLASTYLTMDQTNRRVIFATAPVLHTGSVNGTGTITPVAGAQSTLIVNVSGATTINGPTGGYDGQKLTFRIVNDGTHSVALATGSTNFAYGTTITGYTNSASTIDYIGVIYDLANTVWHVVSLSQGF